MKTRGKYLRNPAPAFSMIVANPKKKKGARKARKNPARKASKKAGVYVVRKPAARKRNPAPVKIAAPAPAKRTRKRRKISRKVIRKNPINTPKVSPVKTMKKQRRKRSAARSVKRNPAGRTRSRRSSRSRSRMLRNPFGGVVGDMFNANTLTLAGGVVIGNIATTMILNRLVAPANGVRPFDLPGVSYAVPAAEFYKKNWLALAVYKVVLGAGASYLLRNQSPRLSQGLLIGTVAGAISDTIRNTGVLAGATGQTGAGRYFPARGAGAYVPGVNPVFTGPASAFIGGGSPTARRGTGATVNRAFAETAASGVPNPFGN